MTCLGYHLHRHPMSGEGWLEACWKLKRFKVDSAADYVRDCQRALDAHFAECRVCLDVRQDYVDDGHSADLVGNEELCAEGCALGKLLGQATAEHETLSRRED